jgi:hypothetical protein
VVTRRNAERQTQQWRQTTAHTSVLLRLQSRGDVVSIAHPLGRVQAASTRRQAVVSGRHRADRARITSLGRPAPPHTHAQHHIDTCTRNKQYCTVRVHAQAVASAQRADSSTQGQQLQRVPEREAARHAAGSAKKTRATAHITATRRGSRSCSATHQTIDDSSTMLRNSIRGHDGHAGTSHRGFAVTASTRHTCIPPCISTAHTVHRQHLRVRQGTATTGAASANTHIAGKPVGSVSGRNTLAVWDALDVGSTASERCVGAVQPAAMSLFRAKYLGDLPAAAACVRVGCGADNLCNAPRGGRPCLPHDVALNA